MYRVVKFFTDAQDNGHAYNVGDEYPREGLTVTQDRIDSLSTCANRQKTPMIEKVEVDNNFDCHTESPALRKVEQEDTPTEATEVTADVVAVKPKRSRKTK